MKLFSAVTYARKNLSGKGVKSYNSIIANILATLLLRIASRASFVLLSFYLGERVASAAVVAVVLEAFYVSEILLAPVVGSLSDRLGRKPFLLLAPLLGCGAALCLLAATYLEPHPNIEAFDSRLVLLLLIVLIGRLLEGATTALNAPASLGSLTDSTIGSETLRTRAMTAFEVVTVGGLALGIPFGGMVSQWLGTNGFFVIMALHLLNMLVLLCLLRESVHHEAETHTYGSLTESLKLLSNRHIFALLPAWLAINALIGAWITLTTIILAYSKKMAEARHPGQLLYGGFSQGSATLVLTTFALVFLIGMSIWMLLLPRMRRALVMLLGLGGLGVSIAALTLINGLGDTLMSLSASARFWLCVLLPLVGMGILFLSGFTQAALNQMAAIAEKLSGKRGAVM